MRIALSRFAGLLRGEDVLVSAAELIDAARALETIDVVDRQALHDVLAATLVRRREHAPAFDRAFAAFFKPPRVGRKRRRKAAREASGVGASRRLDAEPSPASPSARRETRPASPRGSRDRPAPQAAPFPCRVLSPPHRRARAPASDTTFHRPTERSPRDRTRDVSRKPFREPWTTLETSRLDREIARLLARIRLRVSRRKRLSKRGRLALHRMMRRNLATDGVPFRLVRERRGRREQRLLVAVDVSHSVRRAAAAFLAVAAGLAHRFRSVKVYAFVDRAEDVSGAFARMAARGRVESLAAVLARYPDLNPHALSDYGRVFFDLQRRERRSLRRDTLVVILGDARNNRFDPAVFALEEIHGRVRGVIWLVPEPRHDWDRGDSEVRTYAAASDVVCEAADLAGLSHAIERVVAKG